MSEGRRWSTSAKGKRFILLLVAIQWVVYVSLAYDPVAGVWCMFNPDSMHNLAVARTWVHGHPLRLHPAEPPSTILSDLLSPLLFSVGYWLGFKSPSHFVLWAYLECLAVALLSATVLWRFFRRFVPEVVFPATLLCMLFPGIFVNIFATNFGFSFLFFWTALAFMDSFAVFTAAGLLAGLMRPEGLFTYLFLICIYATIHGRRHLWRLLPGIGLFAVPPLVYHHLTGSLLPQGVAPQSIITYQGPLKALFMAAGTITDHIKGMFLGLFPSTARIGMHGSTWIGVFPPLLVPLALIAIARARVFWLGAIATYMLLLVVGDSFSIFSGIHFHRHLHLLSPFVIGFGISFLQRLRTGANTVYVFGLCIVGLLITAQALAVPFHMKRAVKNSACDAEVVEYLLANHPEQQVIGDRATEVYWADGRIPWFSFSPADNPILGRCVKHYHRPLETTELIQRLCPPHPLVVSHLNDVLMDQWLRHFEVRSLASFTVGYKQYATVMEADLSRLVDTPPWGIPCDELDVGDPLSEYRCAYRYRDSLERPVGSPLMQGDGFWDGGRPSVIRERFRLEVPSGGGWLVARYKGSFSGTLLELFDHSPVELSIEQEEVTIRANGHYVFADTVRFEEGFFNLLVPLDIEGDVSFQVEGLINSFHYWTYTNDAIGQGVESPGSDQPLPASLSVGNPSPS